MSIKNPAKDGNFRRAAVRRGDKKGDSGLARPCVVGDIRRVTFRMTLSGQIFALTLLGVFGAGLAAPSLRRVLGGKLGPVLALIPLGAFVFYVTLAPRVGRGDPLHLALPWADSMGIPLTFHVDGLSLLFLLVISLVGVFVVLYAAGYLKGSPGLGKFYLYLMGFMGAMLGIVSSDNLILLFIFWELTSITSFLLIGYYHKEAESRRSALQALLVTGAGGLAMLAGFILLGSAAGTYEISEINALPRGTLTEDPRFSWIFGLILLGAFTKSAQFPFHFWLPNAMAAPAPVSSFLHSATMVKAGVFLLARLHPSLSDHAWWTAVVAPVGALTLVTGVFLGMGRTDLKKILAYTTLAVLGTLTMLLGIGTEAAIKACLVYLLAHALYKAALFMSAGSVDHETGSREIDDLSGLRRSLPLTATGAVIGALSMAGIPLLLGFVSKEYFYKALLGAGGPWAVWEIIGVGTSMLLFALAAIAGVRPFFGPVRKTPKPAHEAPWTMWLGPLVLGALAIKFGLFPGWVGHHLISPAAGAVAGDPSLAVHLELWHGWNTALMLSIVTVIGGAIVLAGAGWWRRATAGLYRTLGAVGPERAYDAILAGVLGFAGWQTRVLQNGKLRNYILTVGGFATALLLLLLPRSLATFRLPEMLAPSVLGVAVCGLIMAAAILACFARSRFAAILTLGVVGLGVAILFYLFSAPDLAMTQILVETLTVVLFVLAFYRLPMLRDFSSRAIRVRDAAVAAVFGTVMAALVMVAFSFHRPAAAPISDFMAANSLPLAQGRNVVNVILVDFRALDTLGEITVLAVAALGVFAMLRLKTPKP